MHLLVPCLGLGQEFAAQFEMNNSKFESGTIRVSLIIPVYNCASSVLGKLDAIRAHLASYPVATELIVVDDCSRDATVAKISGFATEHGCTLVQHKRNLGKGGAVLSGMRAARGDFIIFTDCDLAYPLTEMDKIYQTLESGADMAVANRRNPESICEIKPAFFKQMYSRETAGRRLNQFIQWLNLTDLPDTQAGLKGFRASLCGNFEAMTVMRFGFDVELLLIARLSGALIVPIPVRYQFFEGESSVRILRDGSRILRDILKIWWRARRGQYKNIVSVGDRAPAPTLR